MRPDHPWATAWRETPCLLYGLLALLASCDSRPTRVSPFAFERTHLDLSWPGVGLGDPDAALLDPNLPLLVCLNPLGNITTIRMALIECHITLS